MQSEAALSQSTFNIEKITDIQSRFRGGDVSQTDSTIIYYIHNQTCT